MIPADVACRLKWRLLFSLLAAALSMWSSWIIYQSETTGSDENSYIFQAHNFSQGCISRPAPVLKQSFDQDMIILDNGAGWLSRYPPGHPLWLVPGVWLGRLHLMIALAAGLGMWFVCAAASESKISEVFVALPLLCSPFFGFMYGTLLSHTSGFMAAACLLWAYLRWRHSKAWIFAVIAGLAWSLFFLNRTYTALLVAIPFGCDAVLLGAFDRSRPRWKGILLFALASGAGVLAYLFYNRLTTGDFFTATYLYYAPSENLGFGLRRTQGIVVHHTLRRGIWNLLVDVQLLNSWLLGFKGSLIVWLVLVLAGWKNKISWLLAAATLSVWLGYVYFWYPGVQDAGGPAYFFETIPLLMILGGLGLQRIWNRAARTPRLRGTVFSAAAVLLVIVSAGFSAQNAKPRIKKQSLKRAIRDVIRSAPPQSLVFIENLKKPYMGGMVENARGLDSDPLLMRSMYQCNVTAMRLYSNRTPFILYGHQPDRLVPLERDGKIVLGRHAKNTHHQTGRDQQPGSSDSNKKKFRIAEPGDPAGGLVFGQTIPLPRGHYDFVMTGDYKGIREDCPTRIEIYSSVARAVIGKADLIGSSTSAAITLRVMVTNAVTQLEPRVHYGGSGTVIVERVSFEEIP